MFDKSFDRIRKHAHSLEFLSKVKRNLVQMSWEKKQLKVFLFNNFIVARALYRAHKSKKKFNSALKTSFLGGMEVGGVSIFSSILIQSKRFKMIIYSTYIEVFIFKDFIPSRALSRPHKFKKT